MNQISRKAIWRMMTIFSALLIVAPIANAGVIFEDNFDADIGGIPASSLLNWNIEAPTIDVVGGASFGALCNGSTAGNCVDMDGTPGNGKITTKVGLSLGPGDYNFSFDFGNNSFNDNSLSWTIGSVLGSIVSGSVSSGTAQNNTYTNSSTSFSLGSAISDVFITFVSAGPEDNGGTILDNVLLESTSVSSVPEPESVLLLALGAFGFAIRGRKPKSVVE